MNFEDLARAVDAKIQMCSRTPHPARLFAVWGDHDPDAITLTSMWAGAPRELPRRVAPPSRAIAIALEVGGWASPLGEGRPSIHPLRRRVHQTVLIYGDGDDISVLRYDDEEEPHILRGAVGVVHELLVACWLRRRGRVA
jgi:hypothetical protein